MKKKRAITQGLSKQELQFMCTALPLDKIYPPTKFHNHSKYSFGDMHRTKVKYESKQRAITKKKANKSYCSCALHSLESQKTKVKYENKQRAIIKQEDHDGTISLT